MRKIEDILYFRRDISPFLVHMTRPASDGISTVSAKDVLKKIISEKKLVCGKDEISDARFHAKKGLSASERKALFCAICMTETPLGEIHCLLDIANRKVELEPFGLVLLKNQAIKNGVEPVWYLNNVKGDKDSAVRGLCSLIESDLDAAKQILPLISIFGQKLHAPGAIMSPGQVDFRWEREWRYGSTKGDYKLVANEIFVGLCPHEFIAEFEALWPGIEFIDPLRPQTYYATKLIAARQRLGMKHSVV